MQKSEIIKKLENFQSWRRGEHDNMPDPKEMGLVLDEAITHLKQ